MNHISDESHQRQAAILGFATFPELKHVFIIAQDVVSFDSDVILWALKKRFQ